MQDIFYIFFLGLIEGLTEFLPVSSTGHLILASRVLQSSLSEEFVKMVEVAIQIGGISAVLVYFRSLFFEKTKSFCKMEPDGISFVLKIFIAFVPCVICGLIFHDFVKEYLFSSMIVSISLILGGIIMIYSELLPFKSKGGVVSNWQAFFIGLFQCFAFVPGVSRSAATIIGGIFCGVKKKDAVEFSFFLAVPTIICAAIFDLIKGIDGGFSGYQIFLLVFGNIVAFLSALFSISFMLKVVNGKSFIAFGIYRIILGVTFIYLFW